MGTDISSLLHRDHEDIAKSLCALLDRSKPIGQIRIALDGLRLCLTAHAEAEDIVLARAMRDQPPVLRSLIDEVAHAHRLQEVALASVTCTPLGSHEWYSRCETLLGLVREHARNDRDNILPALRELAADVYPGLAGKFATERMRQLSMLMPSAPVLMQI
jgi:hypothetical protein